MTQRERVAQRNPSWQFAARLSGRTAMTAGAALVALATGVGASGPQQGQDLRGTQVATVDFMLVAKDGQPVTDLKAEEVTLRIDGKIRPIKSLQFIRVSTSISGAGSAANTTPSDLAPAFATNGAAVAESPRSFVIVVDDESIPIGQEQKLRSALNNFIQDLPPNDLVALITVPHGGLKVPLTVDRDKVRREIANISPMTSIQPTSCQTLTTLSTLETTLGQVGRSTGQPMTVAFISATMAAQSIQEQAQRPSATGGGLSAQGGACNVKTDDFKRVGQAVAASHAQLYIINPDYSQGATQEGIENLRGETNAPLFHLAAGTEPGLYRMARETSGYYVATFDTVPDELTGKPHPSSIKTTRKDADVRDRPYLVVGRAAPTEAARPAATAPTTAVDMVRSGRQFRELSLRATAAPFRNADGSVNVIGVFEPVDSSTKVMTAAAVLFDENGTAKAYWTGEADKLTTWPMVLGLTVVPGKYRLRIGAIDANGRMGLIDDQIVAEIAKAGPLQVSGLMLGVPKGAGFTPRMHFTNEATATAYLEIYGAGEGARVGAQFEIAKTTNGPAFQTFRGTFAASSEEGRFMVSAAIPLASLAAGDYVVRAIVQAAGQPAARVIRTLHKD